MLGLSGDQRTIQVDLCVLRLASVLEAALPAQAAVVLQQNVIADGIYEGAQAFRVSQSAVSLHRGENAREGLLRDVFHQVMRQGSRVKLDSQQLSEIGDEMPLGNGVRCPKPLHIVFVETIQLHP
jgi:hypothetical protein